ncbi:MAG: hypothetical protein J07HQW2_02243 [Haloquadratum walsbyi J07HQW2]|uniref:Uncharacterized protein n=1 Tax=Haloquadratum walsbyi J07HQW2 TaxID=1238425 RepID=U1NG36_9EURY|nr:MAG: hypothetical protein J07HQW2_02243 [Haloquadratum walsbyi J07HQW2]
MQMRDIDVGVSDKSSIPATGVTIPVERLSIQMLNTIAVLRLIGSILIILFYHI